MAFPNAYVDTETRPNRFPRESALAVIAILGLGYFGMVMLVLSFIDGDYSPITEAASLYGVGRFAIEMNVGFFVGGVGMISYALDYRIRRAGQTSKAAVVLLLLSGLVLIMDSYFHTNVPGEPATTAGTIHGFGGLFFFTLAPIGLLLIARKSGRAQLLVTLVSFLIGGALLVGPFDASGLAERLIILVIFSSVIFRSVRILIPGPSSLARRR